MNTLYERLNTQREAIDKRLKRNNTAKEGKTHEQPVGNENNEHYQVCPKCGEKKLVLNSGCCNCLNCGWSACG